MYASQWFLTLYAVYFEMDVVVRIWDVYLVEGRKTIFRIGLAILRILEKKLMSADLGEMFIIFREFRNEVKIEGLLKSALEFTFSKSFLNNCDKEFRSPKVNKEIASISKLL